MPRTDTRVTPRLCRTVRSADPLPTRLLQTSTSFSQWGNRGLLTTSPSIPWSTVRDVRGSARLHLHWEDLKLDVGRYSWGFLVVHGPKYRPFPAGGGGGVPAAFLSQHIPLEVCHTLTKIHPCGPAI